MDSKLVHWARNLSLIALSLFFLPLSTWLLSLCLLLRPFLTPKRHAWTSDPQKTILVTGVSMTKGLTVLRLLSKYTDFRTIGADSSIFSPGRVSRHCHKFHRLPLPNSASYLEVLLHIIESENVDLWISCSGVSSAIEDAQVKEIIEKRTQCKAVQFGFQATRTLHEKDYFIAFIRDECGLTVPETYEVSSHEEALGILLGPVESNGVAKSNEAKGKRKSKDHGGGSAWWQEGVLGEKKYILKPIGIDDAHRADMTLLPLPSNDATRDRINNLPISNCNPWLLQEFIRGREYCTHSLVVAGEVKNFVACPSTELLMHYEALPPPQKSKLSKAMLQFTQKVAAAMQDKEGSNRHSNGFTGHLSFDFLVKDSDLKNSECEGEEKDDTIELYPIECNPRTHTAIVLFNDCPAAVQGYLDTLSHDSSAQLNGTHRKKITNDNIVYPPTPNRYYWLPHDLITLLLFPLLSLLPFNSSTTQPAHPALLHTLARNTATLLTHVLFWRDAVFTLEDPVPAWWLYHVYMPGRFLGCLWRGEVWGRVNVGTGKMFGC